MSRKQIQHIRDLHSQRLLATVVAFDSPEGVKVGWSIANWSASGKKESVFVAGMEIVDFTPQPSKKLGVTYAILNAANGINPMVVRKAYVRHSFVKTDLMQEIYKIAENIRNFLETPKKPKTPGKELDHIEQVPFAYTPGFWQTPGSDCCSGCSCEEVAGESEVRLTCFESDKFVKSIAVLEDYFNKLQTSLKKTTEAFKDFCEVGIILEVVDDCLADEETPAESGDVEKGM